MYFLVAILTLGVIGLVLYGIYLEIRPLAAETSIHRGRRALQINRGLFFGGLGLLLLIGIGEVAAAVGDTAAVASGEISIGKGLAIIGVGLPTAFSTIAAAFAIGPIGSASLAVIAERPEAFGRTLIYLGLAEGVAIYGLVISILLLGKI